MFATSKNTPLSTPSRDKVQFRPNENGYRYRFNGKEQDEEGMGGGGSTYDYGFRIYNAQLGKFLSVDPLTASYPWYTPYQFAGNMPIVAIDLDGLEEYVVALRYDKKGRVIQMTVSSFYDLDVNGKEKIINMKLVDENGNRKTQSNVLVIHRTADGKTAYTNQDALTQAQQEVLDNNLKVESGPNAGYRFDGLDGEGVGENGSIKYGIQKYSYLESQKSSIIFEGNEHLLRTKRQQQKN